MDIEQVGNLVEAVLWGAFAVACGVRSCLTTGSLRRVFGTLAVAFFFFGISDLVESQTGAWWRPLWLLVWKGTCLIVLAVEAYAYYRITTNATAGPREGS